MTADPTRPKIPADELAAAVSMLHSVLDLADVTPRDVAGFERDARMVTPDALRIVLAAFHDRGRDLDAAQAAIERVRKLGAVLKEHGVPAVAAAAETLLIVLDDGGRH